MKKLATIVFTLLLAGTLSFAQTGTGSTGDKGKTPTTDDSKAHKGGKKGHKGGKKSKKGSTSTTTPPPK